MPLPVDAGLKLASAECQMQVAVIGKHADSLVLLI